MSTQRSGTRKENIQSRAWRIFAILMLPLLLGVSSGCNQIFGLEETHLRHPQAYDCSCTCSKGGGIVMTVNSTVCFPADLNPALDPSLDVDFQPSSDQLAQDCQNRVQNNVAQMAMQCVSQRVDCSCDALPGLSFADECDTPCSGEDLASDCSNFDQKTGHKTATNVPGQAPVCLVASSDPPDPVPDPLAVGIFGHTSRCEVDGDVTITHGDDSQTQDAGGVVNFTGAPCPGQSCQVGMSYRIDHVDTFEFSGFGGFASAEFTDLRAAGASIPAGATVDASGVGTFALDSTRSFGKGKRHNYVDPPGPGRIETSSSTAAYVGTNGEPIDVLVDWQNHSCAVSGGLLGTLEDEGTTVDVGLAGTIVNEPPTANAGTDMTVECTSAAGASITLNGMGSTDPENNLALFVWRQETSVGVELGTDPTVNVNQSLGAPQTYFLKVVDTFGQTSEDSTLVSVADTTPPTTTNVTATPNALWPPNHKMVGVTVNVSASDLCSPAVCQIAGVSSNEPINGPGDGNSTPDWQITGAKTVDLRAERSGQGSGRVYTLAVKCSDASGNSSTKTAAVTVAHN